MSRIVDFIRLIAGLISDGVSGLRAQRVLRQRVAALSIDPKMKVVVYTAIFGGRDELRAAPQYPNVDYICFTDNEFLRSKTWQIRLIKPTRLSPVREAKRFKILPHLFLKEYSISLWVDGSHIPTVDPRYLVHRYLGREQIALFKHPTRSCIYDEMDTCLAYDKETPHVIAKQRERYEAEKYPRNAGLSTCTVILRNHASPEIQATMNSWWEEIERHSSRDQLSFNYVMRKHQQRVATLPGNVYSNHYFSFREHSRPDCSALRIGWILNGTRDTASTRFLGYNMHEQLLARGLSSKILFAPAERIVSSLPLEVGEIEQLLNVNINVLVIVKLMSGRCLRYLLERCKKRNTKVVYAFCDNPSPLLLKYSDRIVVPGRYYKKIIPKKYHAKVRVSFDGFDHDTAIQKSPSSAKQISLCFVSNQVFDRVPLLDWLPPGVALKIIGPNSTILKSSFPKSAVFKKSPFPFEYSPWSLESVATQIIGCDVGVILCESIKREHFLKSSNRLLLLMALGLPVITSPLPAYLDIVRHGENGFIARTFEEWIQYIELLRDHPELRATVGAQARSDVLHHFSKEKQGELFVKICQELFAGTLAYSPELQSADHVEDVYYADSLPSGFANVKQR